MIKIKIINSSSNKTPSLATPGSAGADLRANLTHPVNIKPLERVLVPTGLKIELPKGYELQIRPRSGLALKHGISVLNSPGTVDSDYRGEIGVILINLSNQPYEVKNGDRIAQMIVSKHEIPNFEEKSNLSETSRGGKGFGSTGKN